MKLLRFLLLVMHSVVLLLLLATPLNSIIPPKFFAFVNFLSLAFPVLLIVHVLLIVVWILLWKKRAFVFILLSVFLVKPTGRWIQFGNKKEEPTENTIKLLSFNTKNASGKNNNAIHDYIDNEGFDLMLFQESGYEQIKPKGDYYAFYNRSRLISVFSKFPILKTEDILNPEQDREVGDAVLIDIDVNGKKVRLITFYLNSFLVKKEMVKPTSDIDENELKYKSLAGKMMHNFRIHQREIEIILPYIQNSPYPVIVTGDLNSVPNSYEYYRFSKLLKDAFVESGNGSGTSFHDFKFPIRIDYVFTSENIKTSNYQVNRTIDFSDHFPVNVELNLPE